MKEIEMIDKGSFGVSDKVQIQRVQRRAYVKSLLKEMVRRGEIQNVGSQTKAARWGLVKL